MDAEQDPSPDREAFDQAMRRLALQATAQGDLPDAPQDGAPAPPTTPATDPEELRRITRGIQALAVSLGRVESTLALHAQRLEDLRALRVAMDQRNAIESANQKLFDGLHAELKSYKDAFLLETLQRPVARDLINLHDDLERVHAQAVQCAATRPLDTPGNETIHALAQNLENVLHHLLEILARLGATRLEPSRGDLDRRSHRIVEIESTASPAEDDTIVRTVRRGFVWREIPIRPEEVVIRRHRTPDDPGI